MFKRILIFFTSLACITVLTGFGVASAAVLPPNGQGNSISVTHNDGHTTVVVVTNGDTVLSLDPPLIGP